jgi:hypothetical protein
MLSTQAFSAVKPPHIGPVGVRLSEELARKVEKTINKNLEEKTENLEDQQIKFLLETGKRASGWLNAVNANRPADAQLDFSRPGSSKGIPITEPMKTSTEILMKQYDVWAAKTVLSMMDVLTSSVDYPINPPVSDQEFVDTLRTLDRIYQNTIRWASSKNWLSWYINRAIFDVRGYIFLKDITNLDEILGNFDSLQTEEKAKYKSWLLELCRNGDFDSRDCLNEYTKYESKKRLFSFYNTFNKYGKSMYDLFFTIKKTRPEIYWNEDKTKLFTPFQTPDRFDVTKWLKENVEDEWKDTLGFNLIIDYKNTNADIPRIQFKEGTTANVNEIAGNLITMESEYPIESTDQKWTIRHEYGHVLGFEDCYLEFYDTNEKAMIYYEIDVDNLMCSRRGHLKTTHIEQLKKAYKASL